MLDCVMLDRAFGDNEDNGIKSVGEMSIYRSPVTLTLSSICSVLLCVSKVII